MKSTTANSIANWFLTRNQLDRNEYIDVEGIPNFKLQKLLYYAYGCYLALYNQKLFTDNIVAWALRKMSQAETPWRKTPQGEIIDDRLIKAYFVESYVETDEAK